MQVLADSVAEKLLEKQKLAKALAGVKARIDIETDGWSNDELQIFLYELADDVAHRYEAVTKVIEKRK